MFCTTCGAGMADNSAFCPSCGAPLQPDGPSAHKSRTLGFHGDGGALLGLYFVNAILTVLTLGVYYFWGKVKVRKYLFNQTDFEGDRFDFHGTGGELLVGAIKIFGIFFLIAVPVTIGQIAFKNSWVSIALGFLFYAVVLLVTPVAIVGSTRYRLSRTSWRGIRFSFRGLTGEFVSLFLRGAILSALTLSFYSPFFLNEVRTFLINHSWFGSQPFQYDGEGKDLFPRYIRAFFLTIVTFGFYWHWWRAERDRYYWAHTSFGGMRFRSTLTGGGLLALQFTNFLIVVFTLGIGIPWAVIRQVRYRYDTLAIEGLYNWAAISQQMQDVSASGEGLADTLNIDMDLGV